MKYNISTENFIELIKRGYSLDYIFLLQAIEEGVDIKKLCGESERISSLYQTLQRKALIFESEDKLTTIGKELLIFINSKARTRLPKVDKHESEFDIFWKAFPGTNNFEYKGRTFQGSRSLRVNKDECRIKLSKILLEGEYTIEEIVQAMEYDVKMKMEESVKTGTNKLQYIHNSLTYLNQRDYEPFIELIKKVNKQQYSPSQSGGVNI